MKRFVLVLCSWFVVLLSNAQTDTLRALCIGNSFTYFYNSHDRLVELAKSEGHTLIMTASYVGGYTFNRHLHDLKTISAIENALYVGAYDVVFLQDQSQAFARYAENPDQYRLQLNDTRELVDRVRMHSPKALIWLEQTWAYPAGNCGGFGDMEKFDVLLRLGAERLSQETDTKVSPIGEAFAIVRADRPDLNLYEPDKKHQSLLGTYLKSCVNYLLIYGRPFGPHADNCTIDPETAAYLRSIAEKVVF